MSEVGGIESVESGQGEEGRPDPNEVQRERYDAFFRFRPIAFCKYHVAEADKRDGAKEHRDYYTDLLRGACMTVPVRKLCVVAGFGVLAVAFAYLLWEWFQGRVEANTVVAIFTVVMGTTTYLQWNAMRQQVGHARREQRPWLAVGEPEFWWAVNRETGDFTFDLTNHGKTPCTLRCFRLGVGFNVDKESAAQMARESIGLAAADEANVVAPGTTVTKRGYLPITFTPEQIQAIHRGRIYVAVAGIVSYGSVDADEYATAFMYGQISSDVDLVVYGSERDNYMR